MKRGQGNTEFIVVVALVAIATIGVITLFGDNIRRLFGNSADNLGGDETVNIGAHSTTEVTDKNVGNFAQNNSYDTSGTKNTPPGGGCPGC